MCIVQSPNSLFLLFSVPSELSFKVVLFTVQNLTHRCGLKQLGCFVYYESVVLLPFLFFEKMSRSGSGWKTDSEDPIKARKSAQRVILTKFRGFWPSDDEAKLAARTFDFERGEFEVIRIVIAD